MRLPLMALKGDTLYDEIHITKKKQKDNPGDLHSKEPTCEMPLILLLYRKGNNNFPRHIKIWKKNHTTMRLPLMALK